MNKIDLHLKYKKETGLDREDPDEMEELNDNQVEYIKWLEGIAQSVIDIHPDLIDNLRNSPNNIVINE